MTFPWEQLPATPEPVQPPAETITAIQRDLAYMVTHTAILVHSNRPELVMMVNTPRGQIVPRGECKYKDGSKFELQDIGMPQPGCEVVTVKELLTLLWRIASEAGLELQL